MARRQVQKLSCAESLNSVLPAMPRWKAWLWALDMPGITKPRMLRRHHRERCPHGNVDAADHTLIVDADARAAYPALRQQRRFHLKLSSHESAMPV